MKAEPFRCRWGEYIITIPFRATKTFGHFAHVADPCRQSSGESSQHVTRTKPFGHFAHVADPCRQSSGEWSQHVTRLRVSSSISLAGAFFSSSLAGVAHAGMCGHVFCHTYARGERERARSYAVFFFAALFPHVRTAPTNSGGAQS